MGRPEPAAELQRRIAAVASRETKDWFERYLKGVIEYRGVKTPEVSKLLRAWYRDAGVEGLPAHDRLELGPTAHREPTSTS
ncbi:MAG: DNA alkylation repair protein [Myxococcota bacterium]